MTKLVGKNARDKFRSLPSKPKADRFVFAADEYSTKHVALPRLRKVLLGKSRSPIGGGQRFLQQLSRVLIGGILQNPIGIAASCLICVRSETLVAVVG